MPAFSNFDLPVTSVIASELTESAFQAEHGIGWILCSGQSAVGSVYQTITGNSNVPDLRGRFIRGRNNGISSTLGNSAGELATGTFQSDSHVHNHQWYNHEDQNTNDSSFTSAGGTSNITNDASSKTGTNNAILAHQGASVVNALGSDFYTAEVNSSNNEEVIVRNITLNWHIRIN